MEIRVNWDSEAKYKIETLRDDGAPGITAQQLSEAVQTTPSYIKLVSGGETEMVRVFSSTSK
jgi:hypothetical protein